MSTELSTFHEEEWRPIPWSNGIYEASSMGRIRSVKAASTWSRWAYHKGQVLTPYPSNNGYLGVAIRVDGKDTRKLVHSLVLEAFVGPRPEGFDACHNNGDKADNRLENLRWDSRKANQADKVRHGTAPLAWKHPLCRITKEQYEELLTLKGTVTVSEASRRFSVGRGSVRKWWGMVN
jgi:HNH endonuclease/NUMOD4 motif